MLTFGQCKASSVANVAGVNVQDPQFALYVNDAVRQLLDLAGDSGWWEQVQPMQGYAAGGAITWPFRIDAVLALNVDNRAVRVASPWYSFMPSLGNFAGLWRDRDFCGRWGLGGLRNSVCEFSGTQPMFAGPTPANPFQIQVTADNPADYGAMVTIYGLDSNGQEVFSSQYDGTAGTNVSQRGVQLKLAAAATFTPQAFSMVTEVTKSTTVGDVRAWQYSTGATGNLLAIWRGPETSPQYLFSRLAGVDPVHAYRVNALVKLGFMPVTYDADVLSLGNVDAIKSMVQAIRLREAGDDEGADKFEQTAIRRLNMEVATRFPLDQMPVANETFGEQWPMHRRLF